MDQNPVVLGLAAGVALADGHAVPRCLRNHTEVAIKP